DWREDLGRPFGPPTPAEIPPAQIYTCERTDNAPDYHRSATQPKGAAPYTPKAKSPSSLAAAPVSAARQPSRWPLRAPPLSSPISMNTAAARQYASSKKPVGKGRSSTSMSPSETISSVWSPSPRRPLAASISFTTTPASALLSLGF